MISKEIPIWLWCLFCALVGADTGFVISLLFIVYELKRETEYLKRKISKKGKEEE